MANAKQKAQAFKNQSKKTAAKWKDSRNAKPGDFGRPKIDPGRFNFMFTGEYDIPTDGKLKGCRVIWLIATVMEGQDGAQEGEQMKQMYNLDYKPKNATSTFNPTANLAADLKRLMPEKEEEIENMEDAGDLTDLIDELNDNPVAAVALVTETDDKKYLNFRIEELLDGSGDAPADSTAQAEDEPGDDEPAEDEGNSDDVPVDDDWEPAAKDKAMFTFRGKDIAGVILSSNRAEKTVRVKANGKTYGPMAWDKVSQVE